jgi:hypothetical protein
MLASLMTVSGSGSRPQAGPQRRDDEVDAAELALGRRRRRRNAEDDSRQMRDGTQADAIFDDRHDSTQLSRLSELAAQRHRSFVVVFFFFFFFFSRL